MGTSAIHLPEPLYERILHLARRTNQSPERVVETILWEHLPAYPHVQVKRDRWGEYAIVTGTRTSVLTIVRYVQMGYDVQTIVTEILPHLTPAQVHSALAYYYEHQEATDAEMASDTIEVWQARLRELVGEDAYQTLVGTASDITYRSLQNTTGWAKSTTASW
jgi:uncharacterized protein (DUF433 family)